MPNPNPMERTIGGVEDEIVTLKQKAIFFIVSRGLNAEFLVFFFQIVDVLFSQLFLYCKR